jgi:RNA polymerase sigma-70 factor (ECF subfamily)
VKLHQAKIVHLPTTNNGQAQVGETEEESDNRTVLAAQSGDLAAFNLLVTKYEQRVYNLAFRMLNDAESAADATQDAFFQAYRALAQFRGGSFKAWLLRIASNICYDRLRVRSRRPTNSLEALVEEAENSGSNAESLLEDGAADPENLALNHELARELKAAIQTLPPDQRLIVILSDVQGLSYDEIVQIANCSLGTVKSRLSRGRAKLREYLQQNPELLQRQQRL